MGIRKEVRKNSKGEERPVWVVDFFDQEHQRHKRQFDLKKDADAWELRVRTELRDKIHSSDTHSVNDAGQMWLDRSRANGVERSTLTSYETVLRVHVAPRLGEMRVSDVTVATVEAFCDALLATRPRATASKALACLRRLLKEAQRRKWIVHNVAAGSRLLANPRQRPRLEVGHNVPTREDVQAIIAATPEHWRPLVITAAFTGMRSSELRGLQWDAVDLSARQIHVRVRADNWGVIGYPKSATSRRSIPMSEMVFRVLRERRIAAGGRGFVFKTSYVYGGREGVPISVGMPREVFYYAQRRAGISPMLVGAKSCSTVPAKYNFHSLRHFFASCGIAAGFEPKRLQTLLGHASIKMTYDVYGHLFSDPADDFARLAEIERGVFGGKQETGSKS